MKKLIAIFVLTMLIFTFSGYAAESTDGFNPVTDSELNKMTDAGEKYNIMLTEWAIDGKVSDSHANFPEFYGGAYIDDDNNLVINVTPLNDDVKAYFAGLFDLENVIFVEAKYSYSEILEKYELVSQEVFYEDNPRSELSNVNGVGIAVKENGINLYVDTDSVLSEEEIDNIKSYYDFENFVIIYEGAAIPIEDPIEPRL